MRLCSRVLFAVGVVFILAAGPGAAWADIYQWEWVDPGDPLQGKQQSTTVCPDGAELEPEPGLYADSRDLAQAYLSGFDLTDADFGHANLTDGYLRDSNLTTGNFLSATLTGANLSSTNLTYADFRFAFLIDTDFTNAEIRGAKFFHSPEYLSVSLSAGQLYSTASYQAGDLTGIILQDCILRNWSFAGQNLSDSDFSGTWLHGVDFSNAVVRGANFSTYRSEAPGISPAQLYSTASYQSGDLVGINLSYNDLAGWDFAEQDLTDADLSHSPLAGGRLYRR